MARTRVVITVERGLVQEVYADGELEVVVVDWDTEGATAGEPGVVEVRDESGARRLVSVTVGDPAQPFDELPPDLATAIQNAVQPTE